MDDTAEDDAKVSPKTGDSSMIMLLSVLALVSMGTIVFVRKKQQ